MTRTQPLTTGHLVLIFGVPLLILMSIIYLSTLPVLISQEFCYALSADLIFTIPVVYYLLIRKTKIPKTTVVPFIILGIIAGRYFLPVEHQGIIDFAQTIGVPLIEFSILGFLIFRVRKIVLEFRKAKNESPDFVTTLRKAAQELFSGKLAEVFVLEISMIYYCFFAWKKPKLREHAFTYHRKNDLHLIFGIFIGLVIVETFVFHILVERWSPIIAWIGTFLSTYSIVQIVGIIKSASRRPIIFEEDKILLRFGMMHETEVRFDEIKNIELSRRTIANHPLAQKMGTALTGHNVIIFLKNENILLGLFGIKKKYNTLMLHVDDHIKFKEMVEKKIT